VDVYDAFYKGKYERVEAFTPYSARTIASLHFRISSKREERNLTLVLVSSWDGTNKPQGE